MNTRLNLKTKLKMDMEMKIKIKNEMTTKFPGFKKPKIVLGVTESDAHVVANHLISLILQGHGFNVINLGACTPIGEFIETVKKEGDVLAVVMGSLNGHALEDIKGLNNLKMEISKNTKFILGGNLSVGKDKKAEDLNVFYHEGIDHVLQSINELIPLLDKIKIEAKNKKTQNLPSNLEMELKMEMAV